MGMKTLYSEPRLIPFYIHYDVTYTYCLFDNAITNQLLNVLPCNMHVTCMLYGRTFNN